MILRWTCAAMQEAEKKFRRVQGCKGECRFSSMPFRRTMNGLIGGLTKQKALSNRCSPSLRCNQRVGAIDEGIAVDGR